MTDEVKNIKIPPEIEALVNKNAIIATAIRIQADTWSSTEEMLIHIIKALVEEQLRLQFALKTGMKFIDPPKAQKHTKAQNKCSDIEHMPEAKLYFLEPTPSKKTKS